MPISEDEFDSRQGFDQDDRTPGSLSKAELRKTNKPIMEKKRRARINQCLSELKDLILEAMKKDPARHSKLEKADILEMTVRHLQAAQRRGLASAASADPGVLPRFRQGFAECATEATRFLSRPPALAPPARSRLRQHLAACVAALQTPQNSVRIPLVPSRLPSGELALVLPDDGRLPYPPPGADFLLHAENHMSAFQTVRAPNNRPPSPATSESSCDSLASEPDTPPRRKISTTFPTPPSQSSFATDSSPETQKPTVSSTTISPESKAPETKFVIAERQTGTLWRQTDPYLYKQLTPPSINSSSEMFNASCELSEGSPKVAIDYSLTPCTGKKRSYNQEKSGMLSVIKQEPPAKVGKIACAKVSSSQASEDAYTRHSNPRQELKVMSEERKQSKPEASGSQTNAPADMWRPW